MPITAIPANTNPLAKVYGRKVRRLREGLKLSLGELEAKAGLAPTMLYYIETGRVVPNQGVAERLRDCLISKVDFTGQPPPRSVGQELLPATNFVLVKTKIERETAGKLRATSHRLGVSQAAIVHLALDHFLANEPAINTLEKAKQKIQSARIQMALQEAPALRDILECEVDMVLKSGKGIWREPPQQTAVMEVVQHVSREEQEKPYPAAWEEV